MWDKEQSTGSTAQDALHSGFQATCNKGIAKLLRVDDTTVEHCEAFKERHEEAVAKFVNNLDETAKKTQDEFHTDRYQPDSYFDTGWFRRRRIKWYTEGKAAQNKRDYTYKVISISTTHLNLATGCFETVVKLEVTVGPWKGYKEGRVLSFDAEVREITHEITTQAKRCTVKYTPYDLYHERMIPGEALEAVKDAIAIGMTNINVASPIIEEGKKKEVAVRDPIIVAHVGEQMFVIAWFGYDKQNHMTCNI